MKKRVIILGAAGRDFHNFNMVYRNNSNYGVMAFTATQIPNIEGRKYPKELAGKLYPKGIPIYSENELPKLIKKFKIDEAVFSYSDITHEEVMHKASIALANGANFVLLGPNLTMLKSKKPVIAVTAVRTGAGKSPTTRRIANILKNRGKKVVIIRHPMPYGDLKKQIVQRFASKEDLDRHNTTIEEREDYEPHIDNGFVVYSGVDYEKILREAEKETDVILWDGGNNDLPFIKPDLHIVIADPHRAGHELKYHPGETNFRMADIILISKVNDSKKEDIDIILRNAKTSNPKAKIVKINLELFVDNPDSIKGKRVLCLEDGPTLTHGGMSFGAAYKAAKKFTCKSIVDPREYAIGSIKKLFEKYTHLNEILPAMGYDKVQIKELEQTINRSDCDLVVVGTPIDISKIMKINKPSVRVRYETVEVNKDELAKLIRF